MGVSVVECVLGSCTMDLGGNVMVESNQKIDSWTGVSSLCGSATLQERQCRTLQQQLLLAGIPCLWIGLLIGYNLHILLLSLNTIVIPSIARPYVFFL
jgi:hypothetical protein